MCKMTHEMTHDLIWIAITIVMICGIAILHCISWDLHKLRDRIEKLEEKK